MLKAGQNGSVVNKRSPSLVGIRLLAALPEDDRRALERRCQWKRYPAGEQIIDTQSSSRDVYFVVDGAVRIVNYSAAGREITFDEIVSGGHFGDLAALDSGPRSAAVVATAPTLVAILPAPAFLELVDNSHAIALLVMRDLTRMVRLATDRIMSLSTLGANNRVYAEILRLSSPMEQDDNCAIIRPIPVHSDIASRVSTSRETVARVFGQLTKMKILRRDTGAIVVRDVRRLADMVEQFKEP